MAREPSRRFITNVVNFASKPWNVAGREVQELIRKILESDQEGRPAEHRLLDPISHQDTERADPTDGAVIRGDGTNWKVADAVTVFDEASAAGTYGFLNVTGTLPAVPSATAVGAYGLITSAGSASFAQFGVNWNLLSGYTGASSTVGGSFFNGAAGTAASAFVSGIGNFGINAVALSSSAGAHNVGVIGTGTNNGVAGLGIGVLGRSNNGGGGANGIGVAGFAVGGSTANVGGYFSLGNATPTLTSTGLLVDNAAIAAPILIARDNGTQVFSIQDGGGITVKGASLTSTTLDNSNHVIRVNATAGNQTFVLPAIATANRGIWYRIKKIDSSANTVIISRTGADTIDGAASQTLTGQYESVDVLCPDTGTDWLTLGASAGIGAGILSGSGTLNTVPKWTPDGTTLGNSTVTDDGTVVTINTATTARAAASFGAGFLNVVGALPNTGTPTAAYMSFTPAANTTSGVPIGLWLDLNTSGGTDGTRNSIGLEVNNYMSMETAIFPTNPLSTPGQNLGTYITSNGTGPVNIGSHDASYQGKAGGWNIGTVGEGRHIATNTGIGGYFLSYGTAGGTPIGVIGALGQLTTFPATAALFDNKAIAAPIAIFRDNGTEVFSIQDGGGITVKTAAVGSTTLNNGNHVITADATAGAVTYTLPAISATTRGIWYRIKKIDASVNTVTIARTGADTIDGAASQIITLQYQSIDIICPSAGTDWLTLGASTGLSGTDDEARAMAFMAL